MHNRKKVAVIGTVGLPAKYGGFETLAEYLVAEKSREYDFLVYCSTKAYEQHSTSYRGAQLKYMPLKANGVQSIPYDILCMLHAVFRTDILLVLGVSGCIILPFIKWFSNKKIVVNIDGLEWKRDKWGTAAKKFLKFSEKLAVNYADIVVADNKVIQEHVKERYGKEAVLIPYGADHCRAQEISEDVLQEFPFLKDPYAFKVCRIEPENNIHLILEGLAAYGKLNLVIIGNWENSAYSRKLRETYKKHKNLYLLDPIYDQHKLNQIRSNCFVYVHGHSAGGTNPSLVEAMYLKLPILAYGVQYNRETTHNRALYFQDKDSLVSALENMEEAQRNNIATEMFNIAKEKYTWKIVADQYAALFN